MVMLPDAHGPDGVRLYAIGDVHGCLDALTETFARIEADLVTRPARGHRVILLGDYVDRGPDSAGVLEVLARLREDDPAPIVLCGNHDAMMLGVLQTGDPDLSEAWLRNGGLTTLASYGLGELGLRDIGRGLAERLRAAVPEAHRALLEALVPVCEAGDYVFVHAGIRPGVPLPEQSFHDLLWIRGEFLDSAADHGAVVVHGHTPRPGIDLRPNRIGIDTGCVFWGTLTCLVIEGNGLGVLGADGVAPLDLTPSGAPSQPG